MFYGFDNAYGIGMRHVDGGRIGLLHVFRTRELRDAWVNSDTFDGNYHREALPSREARPYLAGAASYYTYRDPCFCETMGAEYMRNAIARGQSDHSKRVARGAEFILREFYETICKVSYDAETESYIATPPLWDTPDGKALRVNMGHVWEYYDADELAAHVISHVISETKSE